jgi:hypothetical protein
MAFFLVVVLAFVLGSILRLCLIKVNENKYGYKLNGIHQFLVSADDIWVKIPIE